VPHGTPTFDIVFLEEGNHLNNNLIDFWMCWISQNECAQSTPIFYKKLVEEGVQAVSRWTINKVAKKLILNLVNLSLHWSLSVVVNPGAINGENQPSNDAIPVSIPIYPGHS